ncbi:MAG: hypothetical protein HDR95_02935 [Bacteroides sp.]|nr:hypothetical protein [Bacteroides sp.]
MNDTSQLNDASDVLESLMKQVRRGSDPIPGVLPLVGLGLPQGKTSYEEADLKALKSMGFNTMSAHFPMEVKFERVTGSYMYTYVTYDGNLTKSIQAGASVGMRVIAGTEHAVKEITSGAAYDKIAWSAIASNHKNKYGCPAWMLNVNATVDNMDRISDTATTILEQDHWHKPVIYPLLPGSSTIEELGGSAADGWTEANKFDRYCNELEKRCPPSIWWVTEKAFLSQAQEEPINPQFLKQLSELQKRSLRDNKSLWSTVHCSMSPIYPTTGSSPTILPFWVFNIISRCIGTEARAALAMGAKGLVFDSVCGEDSRLWYPANDPQKPSVVGGCLKAVLDDINKVSEAFKGTYVSDCGIRYGDGTLMELVGAIWVQNHHVSSLKDTAGNSDPLLISSLINPNGSSEYMVIVNLSGKDRTLEIEFDTTVKLLNDDLSGTKFTPNLGAGEWCVFKRQRPLTDFGLSE